MQGLRSKTSGGTGAAGTRLLNQPIVMGWFFCFWSRAKHGMDCEAIHQSAPQRGNPPFWSMKIPLIPPELVNGFFCVLGMAKPCKACPASLLAAPAQPEPASKSLGSVGWLLNRTMYMQHPGAATRLFGQ